MKNAMATATVCVLIVLSAFLSSCFPEDELGPDGLTQKTGKIHFQIKDDPRATIKLSAARTSKQNDIRHELTFLQDGKVVRQFGNDQYADTLEMPVGSYEVNLKVYEVGGKYDGYVEAEGSETANVYENETQMDAIYIFANYMDVEVYLKNMDGAQVWVGEEGFTPSAETLLGETNTGRVYTEKKNFDVLVEYDGTQKRYSAEANLSYSYIITLNRQDEETTDTGNVKIEYYYADEFPQYLNWEW